MFEHLYEERSKTALKAYILVIVGIVIVVAPIKQIMSYLRYQSHFPQIIKMIDEAVVTEIPLEDILILFERTPYRGQYKSSVKPSQFLKEQSGIIEVRTVYKKTSQNEGHTIEIKIFNGEYLDNGRYDITIDSNSFIAKQFLEQGQIIYESDTPLIGFYRNSKDSTYLFHESKIESLFINKLKLRLIVIEGEDNTPEGIQLQFQLSSQFKINLKSKSLQPYAENYHDIFLAFLLIVQCCLQINGVFYFYNQVYRKRDCGSRYSIFAFCAVTISDGIQIIFLMTLCFSSQTKFTIYCIPAFLLALQLFFMELKVLKMIDPDYEENYFMFFMKVYGSVIIIYLMTYFFALDGWLLTAYSCSILFPQMIRNYIVGHKMKDDLNKFFLFSLPRYGLPLYIRAYKYNVFDLRPNYLFTFVNIFLLFVQVLLLMSQKKYGVRAILPKFMHPSEFKYFMNEPGTEEAQCSICLVSLKEKPPSLSNKEEQTENKSLSADRLSEEIYNNVVLTPCRHRFHIECLVKWMQTKLQCPNCRTLLPPLEDYQ